MAWGIRIKPGRARQLKTCVLALVVMAGFALLELRAADILWLRRLETTALDLRLRWRGAVAPGPETVIVLIDEKTIAQLGRWPVPREKLARLVSYLHKVGARVTAFDILFSEAEPVVPEDVVGFLDDVASLLQDRGLTAIANEARLHKGVGDLLFAKALAEAENVILPFTFRFDDEPTPKESSFIDRSAYSKLRQDGPYRPVNLHATGVLEPIAPLADAAAGLAHVFVALDVDGAPRYDYPVLEYDLDFFPSMPIRIAQLYLRVPWEQVEVRFGTGISVGPTFVPTDSGMRVIANYRGPTGTFPTFSFVDVLDGKVPEAYFRDRIVLVGANIIGVKDTFQTPFTSVLPGVERLASLVDTVIHGDHVRRIESAAPTEAAGLLAAALIIGVIVSLSSATQAAIFVAVLFSALVLGEQAALAWAGLWYSLAVPTVAIFFTFTAVIVYRHRLLDRENRRIREAFARYLAPAVMEALTEAADKPRLDGERRELTVLFCDIHGFGLLAERLDPRRLTWLVNEFFTVTTDAILEHEGTVDKFVRDGLIAFWNAPVSEPRHPERACHAALAVCAAIARLNERLAKDEKDIGILTVGVGISSGSCTVGNLGSRRRFDYGALGAAADIAAALEELTRSYGLRIMVGPETASRAAGLALLPIDRVQLPGQHDAIEAHVLLGDELMAGEPGFAAFRQSHLYFRAAWVARDWKTAEQLLPILDAQRPAELKRLYEGYHRRLAQLKAAELGAASAPASEMVAGEGEADIVPFPDSTASRRP